MRIFDFDGNEVTWDKLFDDSEEIENVIHARNLGPKHQHCELCSKCLSYDDGFVLGVTDAHDNKRDIPLCINRAECNGRYEEHRFYRASVFDYLNTPEAVQELADISKVIEAQRHEEMRQRQWRSN